MIEAIRTYAYNKRDKASYEFAVLNPREVSKAVAADLRKRFWTKVLELTSKEGY